MHELSKLEWYIPRFFPDIEIENDIYCLGNMIYILKNKKDTGPRYWMLNTRLVRERELIEFIPEDHLEIDLSNIPTYRIDQQIGLKDEMIEKTLEYLETVPEYTLIVKFELDETVFGKPEFIEPDTLRYPSFDLEYSMIDIYYHDLIETANERGVFLVDLDEAYLENMEGFIKGKRQSVLRKNCSRILIESEEQDELIKETFSGHSLHIIYSKTENRISEIRLVENPVPRRKSIPSLKVKNKNVFAGYDINYLKDDLIRAAYNNDLGIVKDLVNKGYDINFHDKDLGYSVLSAWLYGYYYRKEGDLEEFVYRILDSYDYGDFPPDILCVPLEHRKDGLLEAMEWMLENGLDLKDGYGDDHEIEDTPLSFAIKNMDYYLTEYLLEHGEDPYEWFWTDPEDREEKEKEDWLGRIIAGRLEDCCEFVYTATWLKFAKLLRKYNYTGYFDSGSHYSLIIHDDNENVEWKQTRFNMF